MVQPFGLQTQFPSLGVLRREPRVRRGRDGLMQTGRPATGLEALAPAQVRHDVGVDVVLHTERRVEDVPGLTVRNIREVSERPGHDDRKPVEIALATEEVRLHVGVASTGRESPLIGQVVVGVDERRDVLVLDIVGEVIDEQHVLERHIVVHVAGFLEVVEAADPVQLVVQCLAQKLDFLRPLVLVLGIGDFRQRLGCAVEIGTDVPLDLAITGDGLQLQAIGEVVDSRRGPAERVILGEVRTVGIGRIHAAGVGCGIVEIEPRLI